MSAETEIQHIAAQGAAEFISKNSAALDLLDPAVRPVIESLITTAYTQGMLANNELALSILEKGKA